MSIINCEITNWWIQLDQSKQIQLLIENNCNPKRNEKFTIIKNIYYKVHNIKEKTIINDDSTINQLKHWLQDSTLKANKAYDQLDENKMEFHKGQVEGLKKVIDFLKIDINTDFYIRQLP